ncbi:response regulator transcription factor [Rickettsiaceae bacterium]|nr:response regulator transcription factor [Rickettsiaceae bacterium]
MTNKPHILIVDDDNRILKLLKKFLSQNDFLVSTSKSSSEALELLANFTYDLIILDVMMPEVTGLEFATKIKDSGSAMPIVMLTALSEPEDRVRGLESGANDYMTKPFEPRELLLRINNLINSHNSYKKQQQLVRLGNNSYNTETKELSKNDEIIKLSSSEENLLDVLIKLDNEVITREELSKKMGINPRSIDVQITRLRGKIEPDPKTPQILKTVRNKGYVLHT